jgi:hypothetical protein
VHSLNKLIILGDFCKDIAWRASWQARVAAAVLDMNESEWRLQLYDRLGFPKLHPLALQIIHKHESEVADRAQKRSQQEERMNRARERALQRSSTQQLERTNPEYKGFARRPVVTRTGVMTHRRLEEILGRASTETEDSSDDDYIPPVAESDEDSDNSSSDSSAHGDSDSVSADHASEDSDSDDLPPEESLKQTLSILCEVSELGGANEDTLFIVADGAEFAEIDLRHSEAFTA